MLLRRARQGNVRPVTARMAAVGRIHCRPGRGLYFNRLPRGPAPSPAGRA